MENGQARAPRLIAEKGNYGSRNFLAEKRRHQGCPCVRVMPNRTIPRPGLAFAVPSGRCVAVCVVISAHARFLLCGARPAALPRDGPEKYTAPPCAWVTRGARRQGQRARVSKGQGGALPLALIVGGAIAQGDIFWV